MSGHIIHFDSFVNCRLNEVVKVVIRPFVEHCAKHCANCLAHER